MSKRPSETSNPKIARLDEVRRPVAQTANGSTSWLARSLRVGSGVANALMRRLVAEGVVSGANWRIGRSVRRSGKVPVPVRSMSRVAIATGAAAVALLCAACGPKVETGDGAAADQASTGGEALPEGDTDSGGVAPATGDDWQISSTRDPMSDERVDTATRTYANSGFSFEVTVKCSAKRDPAYSLAAFRDGQAADYDWSTYESLPFHDLKWRARFQVRLDAQPADWPTSEEHRYSNVVTLGGDHENATSQKLAHDAVAARRVTFALHLRNGDATVALDQASGDFGQFLDRCVKVSPAWATSNPDAPSSAVPSQPAMPSAPPRSTPDDAVTIPRFEVVPDNGAGA